MSYHIHYRDRDGNHGSQIIDKHPYLWERSFIEVYTLLNFRELTQEDMLAGHQAGFIEEIANGPIFQKDEDICPYCNQEMLDYGEFEATEHGIEQHVKCPNCNKKWIDVFTLTEQRLL